MTDTPDTAAPRDTPSTGNAPRFDVSVVIPAYNEEAGIGDTLTELVASTNAHDRRYEIIVVDDGSADRTAEIAQAIDGVRVIQHRRNRGYGAALKTGVLAAEGETVAFYDADNQFETEDLHRMIDELDNCDAALGNRTAKSHTPFSRKGGKKMLGWLANYLARQKIPDLNCGLRAMNRNLLLEYIHLWPTGFSASTTTTLVLLKEGYDVSFVPVTVKKRVGTSTVKIFRDGFNTVLLIIRLTTLLDPFRVFIPTAVGLFLIGLFWGGFYMAAGHGLSVGGLFLLVSGVNIFFFGLLADQIAALRRERRYSPRQR
ncbi:MAG: glycosyltransferase family 2 protein [Deltaproteobacteria bacterium]|nr:glycosyltransferase family 2 protein [Deltaproteobacteria bacterium]